MSHVNGDLHPRGRGVYAAQVRVECGKHGTHEVTLRSRDVTAWDLAAGTAKWWRRQGYQARAIAWFTSGSALERRREERKAVEDLDLDDPAWDSYGQEPR